MHYRATIQHSCSSNYYWTALERLFPVCNIYYPIAFVNSLWKQVGIPYKFPVWKHYFGGFSRHSVYISPVYKSVFIEYCKKLLAPSHGKSRHKCYASIVDCFFYIIDKILRKLVPIGVFLCGICWFYYKHIAPYRLCTFVKQLRGHLEISSIYYALVILCMRPFDEGYSASCYVASIIQLYIKIPKHYPFFIVKLHKSFWELFKLLLVEIYFCMLFPRYFDCIV